MEYAKAIELGKIWMKKSLDPTHDFNHAQRVLEHAKSIFNELKPEGISMNMVELAVWWHDSYKSRCNRTTIKSIVMEGIYSRDIFKREVGDLISGTDMELISNAIYQHNRAFNILFNHRKLDSLSMILIEADQLDTLNIDRRKMGLKRKKNIFMHILEYLLLSFSPIFLRIIMRSEYTDNYLSLNIKK